MEENLKKIKYIATIGNIDNIVKQLKELLYEAENTSKAIDRDFFEKDIKELEEKLRDDYYSNSNVFEKNITNKTGKYVVYCRTEKQMEEAVAQANNLFGKVNSNLEISCIRSPITDTKKENIIEEFNQNEDTEKLKLLFLNNKTLPNYNIKNADGVIMLYSVYSHILTNLERIKDVIKKCSNNAILIQCFDGVTNLRAFNSTAEKLRQDPNLEIEFALSESLVEIEKVRREISSKGMSKKLKLALMKQYKEETGEDVKTETKFKGYNLGYLQNNLREKYFSKKLKIDDELKKEYEKEGILGERKRRERKTDLEKFKMLMDFRSKNPDMKIEPETVDEYGNVVGVYRNYLQTSINKGVTDLTPEQIKTLKENNIIYPNKKEKTEIIEKYNISETLYNKIIFKYLSIKKFVELYKKGKIDFEDEEVNKIGIVLSKKELPIKKKQYYIQLVKDMAKKDILKNTSKFIIAEEFDEIFDTLSEREKYVLSQRYQEDGKKRRTYDTIAEEINFSREYVKQIHFKALEKIYEKLPIYDATNLTVESMLLEKQIKELEKMSFEEWRDYEIDKSVDILDITDLSKIKLKKNGFNKIRDILDEKKSNILDKISGLGNKKKNQVLEQVHDIFSNITEERKISETEQLKEQLEQINIKIRARKIGYRMHLMENIFDKEVILPPSIIEQSSLELKKQEKMQKQDILDDLEDEIKIQDKKTDKLETILEEEGITIKEDRRKGEE